jgi:hypothetical protein
MMLSATEATIAAYLASTEAALNWTAARPVTPHVRRVSEFRDRLICQPTQALPETQNIAGTVKVLTSPFPDKTKADISVSQLLKFAGLGKNWDGYGAAKPNKDSLDAARSFIRSLAPESIVPQPALHADGNVILFHRSDDVYVELEFAGTNIEFFARRGGTEWANEFQVGAPLPAALFEIGFST